MKIMEESSPRIRPYLDWDNEDKYSVANSQAPLQGGEDDHPERGTWTGKFDFLLSLLGYSVGLGNVWRFPYLCYSNGGGAFLIPFTVMLIIAGLPLMFMELSLGQYASLGPVAAYKRFCPLLRGLGYGMVLVSSVVMLYYNLIIAWTLYYIFASVVGAGELPWAKCEEPWSTEDCYMPDVAEACFSQDYFYYKRRCYNTTQMASMGLTIENITNAIRRPPAEEYFTNHVLGMSSGIEETGSIRPSMATSLFLAWVIVFLCLSKGVQSSGKVVYFTALFPYVVLIALFVRGILLPGAKEGILFYLTPDWRRLMSAKVWGDAAVQIFFALSPAWGGLITLSSYNKFTNNCYKDSLIVAVSNIGTSFFAGLVIFSVIGFLAHELDVPVASVVDQGAGLAFIVYPEVVARLPVAPLWSLLFFVMLLTLGLDSQFALMETVTTAILDGIPALRNYKFWVVLSAAVLGYAGGIIFTTNAGMYWLQLMDKYAANWSVLLIAISECILVAWIYGADRFLDDVQQMIGPRGRLWRFFWTWMWKVVTPAALFFILFFNWVEYEPLKYGSYVYPKWADAVGWVVGILPVLVIVGLAISQLRNTRRRPTYDDDDDEDDDLDARATNKRGGKTKQSKNKNRKVWYRARMLLQPTSDWGPAAPNVTLTPSRTLTHTPSPGPPGGYDSVRDTIVLVNGQPMMVQPSSGGTSTTQKLPGPSILKNSSKTDLITSQQV
ncbi:sodium- and chloride-dependent glycine transporter 1-like isoform X1 [Vespa mandarinia]|uniref:sodium- and chloride-dependent glycine transporter 1-like isoform X1 n=1 Tax=Vespa mandarinia TaxID=7446 RepID=UPI00160D06C7|nr:sodium- and chloride-dependent glycine transporter 1-like isoform X1 [Vespa mandarinia]XP_035724696.1 sodium- and chloride-dependent glycine transporter 1-like isoform X1 [Vespa mandarinia]XP_035724697.1 sodium- and chloride-dependent glycine transporter 1-like isoform X1 [Vespa mandarinia]XP_035724698.1 sodium- and chloride-dependent glycine transporter 1-like isoform X1 [Vespa mandarinia]XP_035724699.1 sodium- and chloride-dependent glycine transporter 1-like isoform X1 [Vespa mandarinia]